MVDPHPRMLLCVAVLATTFIVGRVAADENLAAIRSELKSGEQNRIVAAISKVESQRLESLYKDVYEVFSDSSDSVVRRHALFLMSRSGAPQVLQMVRQAIDDPKADNVGIRHLSAYELALQRLVKTQDDAVIFPAIEKAIADDDNYYRKYGAMALASHPPAHRHFADHLSSLARDSSDVVRFSFLGKIMVDESTSELVVPILLNAIRSNAPGDRIAAAFALAKFKNWPQQHVDSANDLISLLVAELSHHDSERAGSAGYALAYLIQWPGVVTLLEAKIASGNGNEAAFAATILDETNRTFDVRQLAPVLTTGDVHARLRTIALLARHPSLDSIPLLSKAAADASPEVRKAAVLGLRACGWIADFTEVGLWPSGKGVSTLVLKQQRSDEEESRFAAASEALRVAKSSSDPNVATIAHDALVRIGAEKQSAGDIIIDYAAWKADAPQRTSRKLNQCAGRSVGDAEARDIGSQKQLFIDDFMIDKLSGAERIAHSFKKHPSNPVMHAIAPWEENWLDNFMCSVLYDPESRDFKMWYRCGAKHSLAGYAVSADGIHWQRPNLGVVDYNGSRENNLIGWKPELFRDAHQPGHNVLLQPNAAPDQRYLSLFDYSGAARGFYVSYSPDGVAWREPQHAQTVYGDVATVVTDPAGGFLFFPKQARWIDGYRRSFGFAQLKKIDGYAAKTYPFTALTGKHDELVGRRAAQSFGILAKQTLNPTDGSYYSNWHTQIYSVTPLVYEGFVLGFYDLWYLTGKKEGPLDLMLMATRDRKSWFEVGYPNPVLPTGQMGQWDSGMVYGGSNVLVVDDEIRLYYAGFNRGHYTGIIWGSQPQDCMGVGLATLRLDGFVSVHSQQTGTVTTKPFTFAGQRLQINAHAGGGEIKVAILDSAGEPIPGFTAADCDGFRGDDLRHEVSWSGNADVSVLAGKQIRLRFSISKADLYAFQFK